LEIVVAELTPATPAEQEVLDRLIVAIEELEDDDALEAVQEGIDAGIDPVRILQQGVMKGLEKIGARFEEEEYFLPELYLGGQLSKACIALLTPLLPDPVDSRIGVIVMGAVKGDLHDIGMNLVITQWQLAGFEVHAMGTDVPSMAIIEKAKEVNADIIGLSAFINSTIPNFVEVLAYLRDMGLRDRFKVLIGGGSTTQAHADLIGADGWARDCLAAVKVAKKVIGLETAGAEQ
jgi:5-methyltetrahydrofolate--homocysteine methyltransferase